MISLQFAEKIEEPRRLPHFSLRCRIILPGNFCGCNVENVFEHEETVVILPAPLFILQIVMILL